MSNKKNLPVTCQTNRLYLEIARRLHHREAVHLLISLDQIARICHIRGLARTDPLEASRRPLPSYLAATTNNCGTCYGAVEALSPMLGCLQIDEQVCRVTFEAEVQREACVALQ